MSYTPTNWANGDTITAQKLNKLEQGVANSGGGAMIVEIYYDDELSEFTADKTAEQIYNAATAGIPVIGIWEQKVYQLYYVSSDFEAKFVHCAVDDGGAQMEQFTINDWDGVIRFGGSWAVNPY